MMNDPVVKETQRELLGMIKDIHRICLTNRIKYSLTGGSLLGAVREDGFIPWDDDMDIMIERKYWHRLKKAIASSDKYVMERGPWLEHIRPIEYSSRIEPYVDVFILDSVPDNRLAERIKVLLLRILQGMLKEQAIYEGFSLSYKICIFITHIFGKFFTRDFKLWLYDMVSQIGNDKPSKYISITNDSFGLLTVKHRFDLMQTMQMHDFEDTKLMICKKYDDYLSVRYGRDYMTPPDEKERVAKHLGRARLESEGV